MKPVISLVINTFDRPDALAKVLEGVSLQSRRPDEVLVADDGSGEETWKLVESWTRRMVAPTQHVWQEHERFRRTVILNQAIRRSRGNYLIFLDGDCVPHRDFVGDHERLAEPGFWVQGRRCFVKEPFVSEFPAGGVPVWWWSMRGRLSGVLKGIRLPVPIVKRSCELKGILGCNMAFWRDDLEAVNGYDETYIGWGGEDSDLGARLYHLGRPRKLVHGHAVIYHLNHPPLPRDRFRDNSARLAETVKLKKTRCERGLRQDQ